MSSLAHTLSIYRREAATQIRASMRSPQFLVPSILLPIMFYGLIAMGLGNPRGPSAAGAFATYAIFASIAPGLFGFGAGVAAERDAKLLELKQASPMPIGAYLVARLIAAMAMVAIALAGMTALAITSAGVQMPLWRWASVLGLALVAPIPFALIGLNVGLRMRAQGAVATANLLFIALCVFGGLWFPLRILPSWATQVAWALPTWRLGQLSLMLAGALEPDKVGVHVSAVAAIVALAAAGARRAWRRQSA